MKTDANYEYLVKRIKLLEGIAKGEQAILEGRILTHEKAKKKLKKWLK